MMPYVKCFVKVAIAASAVMATSCVKDVILDAMDEPQVVVDCILTDELVQTLHLLYTKGASRTEAPDLPEAEAVLTDLTEGQVAGHFARTADRSWQLDYATIPGHRYRLDVTVPGHEPIWAEQTMPEAPGVEVRWRGLTADFQRIDETGHRVDTLTNHNIGYSFKFLYSKDPVWFCGINYPTLESPGEPTPYLCTDSPAVDPFNSMEGKVFVEEEEGNYLWGDRNSSGIRTTCYPDLSGRPRYRRFLRFPTQEMPSEDSFLVSGFFRGYISDKRDFVHAKMRPAELHWFSASEDYDRFLQDSYHLMDLKTTTNLADIFVRENAYTNIHGAIGVFGARIERTLEWEGRDTWYAGDYFTLASFTTLTPENNVDQINFARTILEWNASLFLPFELIHFEYCINEPLPDWVPEWTNDLHTVEVIRDEVQLAAHGLMLDRTVDFTKKTVLYCAYQARNKMPVFIGYGRYYGQDLSIREYGPKVLHSYYAAESGSETWSPPACFRFAILVDREDIYAPYNTTGDHVFVLNPLQANSLVNGLYLENYNPFD